ncbi:MAG: hypothetical protein HYZ45_07730, partial [Burkholderiales bacterium]|nr:hypothetical protein [Burkholderiales bacterium]
RVTIAMQGVSIAPQLVKGREDPPLGWISRSFDAKVASPTLCWQETIRGNTKRVTILQIEIA